MVAASRRQGRQFGIQCRDLLLGLFRVGRIGRGVLGVDPAQQYPGRRQSDLLVSGAADQPADFHRWCEPGQSESGGIAGGPGPYPLAGRRA